MLWFLKKIPPDRIFPRSYMDFEQKYQKDPGMNRVKEEEKWRRNWLRGWNSCSLSQGGGLYKLVFGCLEWEAVIGCRDPQKKVSCHFISIFFWTKHFLTTPPPPGHGVQKVIRNFLRADGRTGGPIKGSTRGPRGPKKHVFMTWSHYLQYALCNVIVHHVPSNHNVNLLKKR